MTLYELAEQYEEFARLAAEEDLPPEVIADTFEALDGEIEEKADNIACIIKELEAQADAIEVQENVLNARKLSKRGNAKRLKELLSSQMQRLDKKKIETDRNVISFRKSTALVIEDEEAFKAMHADLCEREVKVKIPRKAIAELINSGAEVSGAMLETRQNISIK